jgi:hypothetical protein
VNLKSSHASVDPYQREVCVSSVLLRVQIAVLSSLTAWNLPTSCFHLWFAAVCMVCFRAQAKDPFPPQPEQFHAVGWTVYSTDVPGFARLAGGQRAFLTPDGFCIRSSSDVIQYRLVNARPARWHYLGTSVTETVYQGLEIQRAIRYEEALAAEVYRGVSMRAKPTASGVKYEFTVAPGHSARYIQLELSGGNPRIDPATGNLKWIHTDGSTRYTDSAPVAWLADGTPVACRFVLNEKRNILSFDLAP